MPSPFLLAARTLAKSPAFTATAIAALALGIGANTAIFSTVNAVLLNPAGVAHSERIVAVRAKYDKLNLKSIPLSVPDFADVRNSRQLFEHAAVMDEGDLNYTGGGLPERLQGARVSVEWFHVFGATPQLGRVFRPEEDQPNANQVLVLSDAAWHRLFGGDPQVLERTVELNQLPYRVVGVMKPDFRWPPQVDLWTPAGLAPDSYAEQNRFNESWFTVAQLRPGVSIDQANAWISTLSDRVRHNGTRGGAYAQDSRWGMFAVPMTDFIAGDSKKPMLILLGAVGFVLLIACTNIAGLMLARVSGKAKEVALRAALGAGRWDLIRQTLAESLLLAGAGSIAGLLFGFAGVRLLLLLAPEDLTSSLTVRLDGTVLLFTLAIAAMSGVLFGLLPTWQIARIGRYESLKEGGRSGTAGRGRQRLRGVLVVSEVALALVLLVGAGLFLRSLARLQEVSTGFESKGVMTATLSLPRTAYKEPAQQLAFYQAVLQRLAAQPSVVASGMGFPLPFSGNGGSASFSILGRQAGPGDPGPHGNLRYVSPGFFAALKIPLRSGRLFTDADRQGTEAVVLIDEVLAKQYWPNENPIGQHMRRGSQQPWATIAGVVGYIKQADLAGEATKGTYYYPLAQQPIPFVGIVAKTTGEPAALAGVIRDAVRAVDASQPVHHVLAMDRMVSASLASRRFAVTLLGFFALTALFLAAIGLYGLISYAVAQRTQEIGIRMALGARQPQVLGLVLLEGLRLTGIGVAAGATAALMLARLASSQLFGVRFFDPLTFGAMVLILLGAALLASYVPARRATRVDPMVALRYE